MARAYFDKKLGRVVWDNEPEFALDSRPRPETPHAYVAPDACYVDPQLPRNCKEHREAGGKFTPDGKCVFDGIKQVEETMARCRDNGSGQSIAYDRPFYRGRR